MRNKDFKTSGQIVSAAFVVEIWNETLIFMAVEELAPVKARSGSISLLYILNINFKNMFQGMEQSQTGECHLLNC